MGFWRAGRVLDARVDVLDVLPEDHHVDFFRVPDRRGNTPIPANRTQADEQIKQLPQGDVQRSDAAADRCRERPFDADKVFAERVDGFVGQPAVRLLEAFFAGEHFHPCDFLFAAVRFRDGRIHHPDARAPDVRPGAVAFDEWNDRIVGNDELSGAPRNRRAVCRRF